jgi:hypothetical protein
VLAAFFAIIGFMPGYLGHPDNYIPANPLVTPSHIVPEWYFLPFYAILRAFTGDVWVVMLAEWISFGVIDAKFFGVLAMFGAIVVMALAPWLDTSLVRSGRYRPMFKWWYWLLVVDFFVLMWVGAMPAEGIYPYIALIASTYWFAYFLVILPLWASLSARGAAGLHRGGLRGPLRPPDRGHQAVRRPAGRVIDRTVTMLKTLALGAALALTSLPAFAAGEAEITDYVFPHEGPFGSYDTLQLQRGLQVYTEVCASCHGLSYVAFRNLSEPGGPELPEDQMRAYAEFYEVFDETLADGEGDFRPATPADRFRSRRSRTLRTCP